MDTKTNERILKALLDLRSQTGVPDGFTSIIQEFYTPDLDTAEIEASLYDLESNSLVEISWENKQISSATLTPKAYGYFREKQERQKDEIIKFIRQTVMKVLDWSVPLAIGYFMGKS
ncbi:hypothetical protein M7775_17200 [Sporomusa sphaeroides DSM 2875]|uniref:hypothetical protein n=1 Tax=Sporomusa sphaeroides TaxID=47679 RepID=UPI002030EA07|nr:hypothetical protein [Sporomusa sphaeroides]MCM0760293.1 hypothetical protein [Sporomusa sphaeroides DSM 2875]